jgi:nucleotide-binding universal stress UspA family protein
VIKQSRRRVADVNGEAATAGETLTAAYPVIVAVDGGFAALRAARWAAAVAERFAASLQIVHVGPEAQRRSAEAVVRSAEDAVRAHFRTLHVTSRLVPGAAGQALPELSQEARLIVLGTHESPAEAPLVGSTAMTVAAHSTCPVVAWRGTAMSPTNQPVVVGVDHDQHSRVAITAAFEFADRLAAPITAVHAWTAPERSGDVTVSSIDFWDRVEHEAQQHLSTTLSPWRDLYPAVEVTEIIDPDRPGRALLHCSPGAQLLVVGSRGSGPVAGGGLGSVGLELLANSMIPVMFCHSVDRES